MQTRGCADQELISQIKQLQEGISEAENVDKNKPGGLMAASTSKASVAAAAAAAKAATTSPFGDEVFSRPDIMTKVMGQCSWEDRVKVMDLNRHLREAMTLSDPHWRWMCMRLAAEDKLYVPAVLCGAASWRELFEELYPLRTLFHEPPPMPVESEAAKNIRLFREGRFEEMSEMTDEEATAIGVAAAAEKEAEKTRSEFQISVCARMRPAPAGTHDSTKVTKEDAKAVSMVLPLHQRLKLIMADNNCSASEARKILWQGQKGSGVDPYAHAHVPETEEELKETLDARAAAAEAEGGEKEGVGAAEIQASVLSVQAGRHGSVLMVGPGAGLREFTFDNVVGERGVQADVYDGSVRRLVAGFVNGANGCVLAYGQTGSGKTHTMFGPDPKTGSAVVSPHEEKSGVVPRACSEVMAALAQRRRLGVGCRLRASYVEVYGDAVTDLLKEGAQVGMWQGVAHRALFSGGCSVPVGSPEELEKLLMDADASKRRAATAMNERSSRAHSVLLLSLHQEYKETGAECVSHMCFADLGGSEQVLKSEVAEMRVGGGGAGASCRRWTGCKRPSTSTWAFSPSSQPSATDTTAAPTPTQPPAYPSSNSSITLPVLTSLCRAGCVSRRSWKRPTSPTRTRV